MGIATYGSMVFSSMKQILNDVHDANVSMVTLLRKHPTLFSLRHETRDTGHIETKKSYLSRGETDSVRRYLVIYPSLSKINSVL
jgi:hypothetical protein